MKTKVQIKFIFSLIVLMLLWGCSNKKNEKSEVNANLDTTTSQELEFPQEFPQKKNCLSDF
jgi:PBP1b-binding outer membrane lipoprotein LpoB